MTDDAHQLIDAAILAFTKSECPTSFAVSCFLAPDSHPDVQRRAGETFRGVLVDWVDNRLPTPPNYDTLLPEQRQLADEFQICSEWLRRTAHAADCESDPVARRVLRSFSERMVLDRWFGRAVTP